MKGPTASKDQHLLVFQRLSGEGYGVWVFTNNLPSNVRQEQAVVYPVAPPEAPQGMIWKDALFQEPFGVEDGRLTSRSLRPLVLILEHEVSVREAPEASSEGHETCCAA